MSERVSFRTQSLLNDSAGLEMSPEELRRGRQRLDRKNLTVLAYPLEGDRFCRAERFTACARALGDRFVGRLVPDSAANPDVAPFFAQRVACRAPLSLPATENLHNNGSGAASRQ
jgi:hypothetical protein